MQRVRFRLLVKNLADELGLTAWVRNRGAQVEILVQDAKERLVSFTEQVKEGPPGAEIGGMTQVWGAAARPARRFRLRWLYVMGGSRTRSASSAAISDARPCSDSQITFSWPDSAAIA